MLVFQRIYRRSFSVFILCFLMSMSLGSRLSLASGSAETPPSSMVPPLIPEPFLPLQGGASGHFYTEPTVFGYGREMAYILWEEGALCIVTETCTQSRWKFTDGPDCGFPGEDRFPSYCEIEERLYFASSRSQKSRDESDLARIWFVSRDQVGGWERRPHLLDVGRESDEVISLSVTRDGDLFFEETRVSLSKSGSILCSALNEGHSRELSEMTIFEDPHPSDKNPCIAPDGSFVVFDSIRQDGFGEKDLYVVFKLNDSSWSAPLNLGETVNGPVSEYTPRLSSSGSILFFSRSKIDPRDQNEFPETMWVDTKVIENLR